MRIRKRFCDGVLRRDFLRIGSASVMGMGLTLADVLERQAHAAAAKPAKAKPEADVSMIVVFLRGGITAQLTDTAVSTTAVLAGACGRGSDVIGVEHGTRSKLILCHFLVNAGLTPESGWTGT